MRHADDNVCTAVKSQSKNSCTKISILAGFNESISSNFH